MKTPDITPAQIAAFVTAIGGQAVAYGLLNDHTAQLAVSITTVTIGVAWKLADAVIRNGRARTFTGARAAAIQGEAALSSLTAPEAAPAATGAPVAAVPVSPSP